MTKSSASGIGISSGSGTTLGSGTVTLALPELEPQHCVDSVSVLVI